jgi:linoleoyl-CoA desaturase
MSHPKFAKGDGFQAELNQRVKQYFKDIDGRPRDCPRMYVKTTLVLAWFFSCYALVVFFATAWWNAVPLAMLLGLATAAIGFNIQHDAGHKSFSDQPWVNNLLSWTLDLVGGSSYFWHFKHGVYHHTFTNIDGHDTDIDLGLLGRLSPNQRRFWFHRWQHFYLWLLYGLVVVKWQLWDDFFSLATAKVGCHRVPRPRGWDLVVLAGGKLLFATLAFGIPLSLHDWQLVVTYYVFTMLVTGVVLSVVFQLAHCVEPAVFPLPQAAVRMESAWAVHQVVTTVDFAPRSRFLTWMVGGLNFQVEHHLFPRVSHTHYPALAGIVSRVCGEFGLPYHVYDTFWTALCAHYRWLRSMGRPALVLVTA